MIFHEAASQSDTLQAATPRAWTAWKAYPWKRYSILQTVHAPLRHKRITDRGHRRERLLYIHKPRVISRDYPRRTSRTKNN